MALSGSELVQVQGVTSTGLPGGSTFQTTTGAIAALAATESSFIATSITTVGNGTLTAAGLLGGQIVRTGPVAAYSDTTDTATAIIAAFPGAIVGSSVMARIKNSTAFTQTIIAGSGVTLPPTVIIPPYSIGNYMIVISSATTVTWTHISTIPVATGSVLTAPSSTSLSTVGAGTILAAGIASGLTTRAGAQLSTAFTDTTDTANNIVAACANLVNKIGTSTWWTYSNLTNAPATIAGGSGVTVSVITVIPPNAFADYLVTYTAASTLTFAGARQGYLPHGGTFTSIGSAPVTVADANITTFSQIVYTLKSVGGTVSSYPVVKTITAGVGFTVNAGTSDLSSYNYTILG